MNFSFVRRGALLALAVGAVACSTPSTTPVSPSVTSFKPILDPILNPQPQVGGLFSGTMNLTSVSGGTGPLRSAGGNECVVVAYQTAVANGNGSNDASLTLTQDTTNPSNVTARLTSEETGLSCAYQGTIGVNNGLIIDAPANANSCTGTSLIIRCLPDPNTGVIFVRELRLVGSSMTATFQGWPTNVNTIVGRTAQTYNIFDDDGRPVGGFVANHDFSVSRR